MLDEAVYQDESEVPEVGGLEYLNQVIDSLDGSALMEQAERLRVMAEERLKEEREKDLAQLHVLALKLGATVAFPEDKPAKKRKSRKKAVELQPKFVDPATGQKWSGRGRQPVWLRNYVEAGRRPSEFSVV
jgi:DNA-binding protein H-NS